MTIQLTPQQQQALDTRGTGQVPRMIDPRTNIAYVLVPEADYDVVRELLEDERSQRAIRSVALRNAAAVPFREGDFGFTADCVAQCENVLSIEKAQLDLSAGPMGVLDDTTLRTRA